MRLNATAMTLLLSSVPALGWAANANHPYSNVDHRVDAGNNTGDAQVDRLNQAQLSAPGQPPRPAVAPVAVPPPYVPGYYPGVAYRAPYYPTPYYAVPYATPYVYYAPRPYVVVPRRYYYYPYY